MVKFLTILIQRLAAKHGSNNTMISSQNEQISPPLPTAKRLSYSSQQSPKSRNSPSSISAKTQTTINLYPKCTPQLSSSPSSRAQPSVHHPRTCTNSTPPTPLACPSLFPSTFLKSQVSTQNISIPPNSLNNSNLSSQSRDPQSPTSRNASHSAMNTRGCAVGSSWGLAFRAICVMPNMLDVLRYVLCSQLIFLDSAPRRCG